MKRFLIFVIISVVSLGLGFTIFRFMTYDEIISVTQTVFQVNLGQRFKLDIVTEHLKRGTVITAEIISGNGVLTEDSSADAVQDLGGGNYEFLAKKGGQAIIQISSNSGMTPINVQVTVGDGSASSPFFISSASALANIGKTTSTLSDNSLPYMSLTKSYMLTKDISLPDDLPSDEWTPIGYDDANGFTGRFDFNGYTISGLNVVGDFENAGLFAKIGLNAEVFNGTISNSTVNANSDYAGIVAGVNNGDINGIKVIDSVCLTSKQSGVAGGLVGLNTATIYKTSVEKTSVSASQTDGIAGGLVGVAQTSSMRASVTLSSSIADVKANAVAGGLVGKVIGGTVENCYVGSLNNVPEILTDNTNCYIGGVVGALEGTTSAVAVLKDTYSIVSVSTLDANKVGAILGSNTDGGVTAKNKIYGNYYVSDRCNVINAVAGQTDPTNPESNYFGVYNKTEQQLVNDIPALYKDTQKVTPIGTYYSCVSTDSNANYYWNFEDIWQDNKTSGKLPTIKADAKYVTTNLEIAGKDGDVNSFETFKNMDNNGSYTLTNNITINRDSLVDGQQKYTPRDFHGSLIGETKEDGTPAWTIEIVVDSPDQLKDGTFALFNVLGKNAIIKNINVKISLNNVNVNSVAAIAIENKGKILNCTAEGTIATSVSGTNINEFMAGLVANNYGIVQDSTSSVNLTLSGAPASMHIGGVVAYNFTNSIVENSRYTGTIETHTNASGYIGGIAGQSDSKVTSCANTGSIACDGNLTKCFIGGVVGYVNNSYLTKSSSHTNTIRGTNVGGVAGFTTGYITECMSKSTLIGDHVGGVVCEITQNYFINCAAYNHLQGVSEDSVLAGMVYSLNDVKKASYATHIFMANTFGQGKKYFETPSAIRGGSDPFRLYELCAEYCIYVEDIVSGGANKSMMPFEWLGWMFGYYYDEPVTDAQAKGSDNYATFYDNGYSTDIWSFVNGEYPMLKNVAK